MARKIHGASRVSCDILDALQRELGVKIRHTCYHDATPQPEFFPIGDRQIRVDGYISDTRTIIEVFGDLWHGHPGLGEGTIGWKRFYDRFRDTETRLQLLRENGFDDIRYIWVSEWDRSAPVAPQLLRFDGTLKTRTTASFIKITDEWVRVSRAGNKTPLVWSKNAPTTQHIGEVLLPQRDDDGNFRWFVDPDTIVAGMVTRMMRRLLDPPKQKKKTTRATTQRKCRGKRCITIHIDTAPLVAPEPAAPPTRVLELNAVSKAPTRALELITVTPPKAPRRVMILELNKTVKLNKRRVMVLNL
jgi:hypothetical protein